jgi:hypothetical protein
MQDENTAPASGESTPYSERCRLIPSDAAMEWAGQQDAVVWSVCDHMLCQATPSRYCRRCPRTTKTTYGTGKHMCRGLAEETVAIVYDAARRDALEVAERRDSYGRRYKDGPFIAADIRALKKPKP